MNSLRAQLERTREEKAEVEDQLSDTQVMLAQEQEEHRLLQHSRAREVELWSDERETSLSLVKEMTREVRLPSSLLSQSAVRSEELVQQPTSNHTAALSSTD